MLKIKNIIEKAKSLGFYLYLTIVIIQYAMIKVTATARESTKEKK